jgi:hypothetical protein
MTYSLAAAAAATDTDESTILKSIEGGKIAATKDELGEWHIEPAELHRVYPRSTKPGSDSDVMRSAGSAADEMDLEEQIAVLIRQAGDRLRQQLDDVEHRRREAWPESQAPQKPPSDKPERHPWWRRIAG